MTEKDHQNIPDPRFEDKEVDSLISNFGVKPSPEKREAIQRDLEAQKRVFLATERGRGNERDRSGEREERS